MSHFYQKTAIFSLYRREREMHTCLLNQNAKTFDRANKEGVEGGGRKGERGAGEGRKGAGEGRKGEEEGRKGGGRREKGGEGRTGGREKGRREKG